MVNVYTNKWMSGWMRVWVDRLTVGGIRLYICVGRLVDGWMDRFQNGGMKCMDRIVWPDG